NGRAVDKTGRIARNEYEHLGGIAETIIADRDPANHIEWDMIEKDSPQPDSAEQIKPQVAFDGNCRGHKPVFRLCYKPSSRPTCPRRVTLKKDQIPRPGETLPPKVTRLGRATNATLSLIPGL